MFTVLPHRPCQAGPALPPAGLAARAGFFISYNDSYLRPNVTDAVREMMTVHRGDPIYVVGHSMGAAVATLCALDLQLTFGLGPTDVRLYTYGSPRVGNQAFAEFVARKLPVSWELGLGLQPDLLSSCWASCLAGNGPPIGDVWHSGRSAGMQQEKAA